MEEAQSNSPARLVSVGWQSRKLQCVSTGTAYTHLGFEHEKLSSAESEHPLLVL